MNTLHKITLIVLAYFCSLLSHGQIQDSIAHTLLVADYDYTCRTTNAQGDSVAVNYGITLQVAPNMACTLGQKRHMGENDQSEQLLYVPTTWQNYPQGMLTSLETIPPYQYLTTEKLDATQWTLHNEHATIAGHSCQKATGKQGGRGWIIWFTENLPTQFGPWRLHGLPGLILRAVSDDGIHSFECREVQSVKEDIVYNAPEGAVKCSRAKFVKLRNRLFSNPNYLTNPAYYIKPAELESVTVIKGTMMLGRVIINMKPAKFQPLDY